MNRFAHRPGVVAGFLLLVVLFCIPYRIASEARSELAAAEAAVAAENQTLAVDHFRRTLRWSLPLTDWDDAAIAGLEAIARERESSGDREGALLAWRSISGGLASTRFLYGSPQAALARVKNEITRLAVPDDEAGRYRAMLDREIAPDPVGGTLLVLGFLGWLVSLVLLIRHGFDPLGRLHLQAARAPLLGAFAGFASFVVGLLLA